MLPQHAIRTLKLFSAVIPITTRANPGRSRGLIWPLTHRKCVIDGRTSSERFLLRVPFLAGIDGVTMQLVRSRFTGWFIRNSFSYILWQYRTSAEDRSSAQDFSSSLCQGSTNGSPLLSCSAAIKPSRGGGVGSPEDFTLFQPVTRWVGKKFFQCDALSTNQQLAFRLAILCFCPGARLIAASILASVLLKALENGRIEDRLARLESVMTGSGGTEIEAFEFSRRRNHHMKSRQRRLKAIELSLTPQQIVVVWLRDAILARNQSGELHYVGSKSHPQST